MTTVELIPALQTAIGPAVLISGVGLLILSLTNRLGRVIDRGRSLTRELREISQTENSNTIKQFHIIFCRAAMLRRSIIFAVLSILFCCVSDDHAVLHRRYANRSYLVDWWIVRMRIGIVNHIPSRFPTGTNPVSNRLSIGCQGVVRFKSGNNRHNSRS